MSENIYMAKQAIKNVNGKIYGYELLYRDSKEGIKEFPSNMKATNNVLMTALTNLDLDEVLGKDTYAFINVDEKLINSPILESLDSNRFVIEILEDTIIDLKLINRIKHLKKLGFKIAIDDFDGSNNMITNFRSIFKYTDIIKVDAFTMNKDNIIKLIKSFKERNINLLIEKVESNEEMREFQQLGFNYFQGYAISKPEIIEVANQKDVTQLIILKLITIIKQDGETAEIESYLKKNPSLFINILKFINNQKITEQKINSVVQAITLLGRDKLSKWLLIYLYSERNSGEISEILLDASISRAEEMEDLAEKPNKAAAFITGLFSIIGDLFNQNSADIFKSIKLDSKISSAIIHKTGENGNLLKTIEKEEKVYLQKIFNDNFDKLNSVDLLRLLERNNIRA